MQKNTVDLMDEVEQDLKSDAPKSKEPFEYEKLLLAEANRSSHEKANNLIKFGCFEQKQVPVLDFSGLERIDNGKKFKGKYQLYRNLDTMQLMYVYALVENNKGDEDERKELAPYAYDVLYIEQMDQETYEMVVKAANLNLFTPVKFAYVSALVLYFFALALSVFWVLFVIFSSLSSGFASITGTLACYAGTSLIISFVSTPLVVMMMMKYKKYIGK